MSDGGHSRRRIRLLLVTAGLIVLSGIIKAQEASPSPLGSTIIVDSPYVATMTFDVASVRENENPDVNGMVLSGGFLRQTTTMRAINWRLESLIGFAFHVDAFRILGMPKWSPSTLFLIEAKGDGAADARMAKLTTEQRREEQEHMLRSLLEDRFQLRTHWEIREGDVYDLVVMKKGPKLGPAGSIPLSADEVNRFGKGKTPALYLKTGGEQSTYEAHGCEIGELVRVLPGELGRPVIDRTGLEGRYDFVLKFKGGLKASETSTIWTLHCLSIAPCHNSLV